jgi:hypothetical protein
VNWNVYDSLLSQAISRYSEGDDFENALNCDLDEEEGIKLK